MSSKNNAVVLSEGKLIKDYIFFIRGHKVMLSPHLAELYDVPTKVLIQSAKRNIDRFPEDFMFQLTWEEISILGPSSRSQFVTLKKGQNIKYLPYAFTEQGVAMLSSILRSKRAIQMNVAIMRAFVKLREIISTHKELAQQLAKLESKVAKHDEYIQAIFEVIHKLMDTPEKPKRQIGFHAP